LKGRTTKGEHLKLRNIAIGTIVPLAAAASFAVPGHAAPRVPNLSGVSLKMVLNSKITLSASFEMEILAAPGSINICSFDLYRQTAAFGFQFLGHYPGTNTTDEISQGWGASYYEMVPYDCSSNVGTSKNSESFNQDVFDSTSGEWSVVAGSSTTVSSSKFYGGSALETLSAGAAVDYNNTGAFNDGVVIATGPSGGIATAYVNGVKQPGTINFYSTKPGYLKVGFKFGQAGGSFDTFKFVETKHGRGGGNNMWFDADVQIY
jgi:hypothetical protein